MVHYKGSKCTPDGIGRELAERGVEVQFLLPTRQSLKGGGRQGKMLRLVLCTNFFPAWFQQSRSGVGLFKL